MASGAFAQTNPAALDSAAPTIPLVYDVISIKPNKSGSGSINVRSRGDSYTASNISLKLLLQDVYDIKEDQISGIPPALDSARFDIAAKVADFDQGVKDKMTDEQQRQMLLPALIDRFNLKTHSETRILPVYELVLAKGGPKLTPSADQTKHGRGSTSINGRDSIYKLTTHDMSMATFAKTLAGQAHRPVIDKSGLAGNFDFELSWSSNDNPDPRADAEPAIFTALQEQLGLKLQPTKGPVETLVVDHAEMPSGN